MSNKAIELFKKSYPNEEPILMKSHGRLEIIGNHTDHNHGLCLVAGASMGISCAFLPNEGDKITLSSEGYPDIKIRINDLKKRKSELGKSIGLVRGVLFKMQELGYNIGGFHGAMDSDIFPGAGVSSSACYESLIVGIVSHLYNEDRVSSLDMAKIGQFSEREYFGKPCGLLDQVGTSFGGIDFLDFSSLDEPTIEPMKWNFPLSIVLINSGGSHAKLTPLYASIPADMFAVANHFGKEYLRLVDEEEFYASESKIKEDKSLSRLARKRAEHFFEENKRVLKARDAVKSNDVEAFLSLIKESQESSCEKLRNTMVPGHYEGSPQKAVDVANAFIGKGACRIMGGGFAGSIIAFVYPEDKEYFMAAMRHYYGDGSVVEVHIPDGGPSLGE